MRVIMLLKSDAKTEGGLPVAAKLREAMGKYAESLAKAGVVRGGEALQASSRGAKVRIARGETSVIDGPFAEAKEVIAGYFVLEVGSLREAVAWAKRLPADCADDDHVELRPMYDADDFTLDGAESPAAIAPPADQPGAGPRWASLLKADAYCEAGTPPTVELVREMGALVQEMAERGLWISGEGLKPSSLGARVYIENGHARVVDGPFTEAKELVAGISIFRSRTRAEALEWARRCLQIHMRGIGAEHGEIEVRLLAEREPGLCFDAVTSA